MGVVYISLKADHIIMNTKQTLILPCGICKGTGKEDNKKCSWCNGVGKLYYYDKRFENNKNE